MTVRMIVLAFDNESGAEEARDALLKLQDEYVVNFDDAAVVIRKQSGRVKVKQANSLVGKGALGGAFWGLLIGLIFLAPWLGLAVGAAAGAIGGKLTDVGIDDKFIKDVGKTIEPGHSALFLLVVAATPEVEERVKALNLKATVLQTDLTDEDEAKLRDMFAADEVDA